MNRKSQLVDVLSSVALIGVVGASVLAQVGGPNPQPVGVPCTGFIVYRPVGAPIVVPNWTCPAGSACDPIIVEDDDGNVIDAYGDCKTLS